MTIQKEQARPLGDLLDEYEDEKLAEARHEQVAWDALPEECKAEILAERQARIDAELHPSRIDNSSDDDDYDCDYEYDDSDEGDE